MAERAEMQPEIRTCNQHEDNGNCLYCSAVKIADTCIVCGKSADSHGCEAVANRIKQRHTAQPVSKRTGRRQCGINVPQHFCGFLDSGRQLGIFDRPHYLGTIQLHAADGQHGQYCNGKNDDTETAQPLQQLAIKQNRPRHVVET